MKLIKGSVPLLWVFHFPYLAELLLGLMKEERGNYTAEQLTGEALCTSESSHKAEQRQHMLFEQETAWCSQFGFLLA